VLANVDGEGGETSVSGEFRRVVGNEVDSADQPSMQTPSTPVRPLPALDQRAPTAQRSGSDGVPAARPPARPSAEDPDGLCRLGGVRVDEVFTSERLERIAKASKGGQIARKKAVFNVAGDAVRTLQAAFDHDPALRTQARIFQQGAGDAIARALDRGKANTASGDVCAFLLIDSALD
jgi:hypothetical protein